MRRWWLIVALGLLAACGRDATKAPERAEAPASTPPGSTSASTTAEVTASTETSTTESTGSSLAPTRAAPPVSTTAPGPPTPNRTRTAPTTTTPSTDPAPTGPIDIAYVLERHTTDDATSDFESLAEATLSDDRGWSRAAFRFERRTDQAEAPYRIILAEGDEVDRLCLPYDTYGKYSCQNGPVVALNADRWRASTPKWTGDLESYRRMLVNHEVGHLLGQKHPRPQCPAPGRPAPIMNQQSTELNGCLPNPWPLDSEVAVAARHDRKLAPGPGE